MKSSVAKFRVFLMLGSVSIVLALPRAASAQDERSNPSTQAAPMVGETEEVVVTARRRGEALFNTPVVVNSLTKKDIDRLGISDLDNLTAAVPQVMVTESAGSAQGGVVVIRGIGVGDGNAFQDQAVSFNVDGIQVARSSIRRMGEFDLAQIDVLKGPQALYFGKNSPAGLIALRTADPGGVFESGVTFSYEFEANQPRAEGYVSGPLSETVGARLAMYGSGLNGYVKNMAMADPVMGPAYKRGPREKEYGGRVTLTFDPNPDFDARFKLGYSRLNNSSGLESTNQLVDCPFGSSQLGSADDCRADNRTTIPSFGSLWEAAAPDLFRGKTSSFYEQKQTLSGLEMNYRPMQGITLTSLTGFYDVDSGWGLVFPGADASAPNMIGGSAVQYTDQEISQELRLTSDFEGPVNFMVGGHFQHTDLSYDIINLRNPLAATITSARGFKRQTGDAWSIFGQMTWQITDTLELSGGARYSSEEKAIEARDAAGNWVVPVHPRDSWENISPEVTLTWRPDDNNTLFASYKTGFLSGGFGAGAGGTAQTLAGDTHYDQQVVKGFELGARTRLMDNRLRLSAALYHYDITGLQTTTSVVDATGFPRQIVANAGKAYTQGIEAEARFEVMSGFNLHANAGYNKARYDVFAAACYAGQSIAAGCDLFPGTGGAFTTQDLAGKPLLRAPDWSLAAGANYELVVGNAGILDLSFDAAYSSEFYGESTNKPGSLQGSFWLLSAGAVYTDDAWGYSVSLLGRNLADKYVFYRTSVSPFTGSGTGTALAVPSDTLGTAGRGREIILQLSVPLDRLL